MTRAQMNRKIQTLDNLLHLIFGAVIGVAVGGIIAVQLVKAGVVL